MEGLGLQMGDWSPRWASGRRVDLVLIGLWLILAACASDDAASSDDTEPVATASEDAGDDTGDGSTTPTPASTADAPGPDASTDSPAEDTTETATPDPVNEGGEKPQAGTGVLTIDGVAYPFTIQSCEFEPTIQQVTGAVVLFAMRGSTMAEGREVSVNASTIETNGRASDGFGYSYVDNPNDFETAVSMSSKTLGEEFFEIDGPTFRAGPVPFHRIEGFTEVEGVEPGPGSIHFTC